MAKIFNRDRYGFICIGDDIVLMRRQDRELTTSEWAVRVCGVDESDLCYVIRGYITPDRIQFFTEDYSTAPDVNEKMIANAYAAYKKLYGATAIEAAQVPMYNGVKQGVEGETWPPFLRFDFDSTEWVVAE